jgi:hypothetical protein
MWNQPGGPIRHYVGQPAQDLGGMTQIVGKEFQNIVGTDLTQLVAPGSIPAQSFTQTAVGTAMALDTVNVGQFVTLDVTNVGAQPANFAASLFGTTLNS